MSVPTKKILSKEDAKKQDFSKKLVDLLKQKPEGILMKEIQEKFSDYSRQFISSVINEMHLQFCMLVANSPLVSPPKKKRLRGLSTEEHNVYNAIERSNRIGRTSLELRHQNAQMKTLDLNKVLKKLLTKNLITEYKTTAQKKLYVCPQFKPIDDAYTHAFLNKLGHIDSEFVEDIKDFIYQEITGSVLFYFSIAYTYMYIYGFKGATSSELASSLSRHQKTSNPKGLPLDDVERIVYLLLVENLVEIVPSTVPRGIVRSFLKPYQNSYRHILEAVKKIRKYKQNIESQLNESTNEQQSQSFSIHPIDSAKDELDHKTIKKQSEEKHSSSPSIPIKIEDMGNSFNPFDMSGVSSSRNSNIKMTANQSTLSANQKIKIEYDKPNDTSLSLLERAHIHRIQIDDEKEEWLTIEGENGIRFKAIQHKYTSTFTYIPCQSCPVYHQCNDGGVINPKDCIYLEEWID
ncbi:hypothetical protein RFI_27827 [Reticulomyxa filosa]|uniref:DNA-directed RNA polymerase III subunit RPC6 n=1 Tax=Reticulomyxa filosa TaxID=46433 RepID=X6M951_RETFI|nr:hypothetical protein RFI_27827 [Reticulomyxa filosa]|eukprot:ETO09550.1 hypothetical protein RFI_27827 [Reticulomyxa filosa]